MQLMPLDINTAKGRDSLRRERMAMDAAKRLVYPRFTFIETPKEQPAALDGIALKGPELAFGYEFKARNVSEALFYERETYLITFDKLERCRLACAALGIPFELFLLVDGADKLFQWHISDASGRYVTQFEHRKTATRATSNDDRIVHRDNAFLPVKDARMILDNVTTR